MNAAYFKKEILRNPVRIGKNLVQWESIGGDRGVKVVDIDKDPQTFRVLEDLADKRRMGVTRISAEIYDAEKKNPLPRRTSPPPSVGQPIRAFDRESVLPKQKSSAPPVAAAPVAESVASQPGTPASAADPNKPSGGTLSAKNPPRAFTRKAKSSEVKAKTDPASTPVATPATQPVSPAEPPRA